MNHNHYGHHQYHHGHHKNHHHVQHSSHQQPQPHLQSQMQQQPPQPLLHQQSQSQQHFHNQPLYGNIVNNYNNNNNNGKSNSVASYNSRQSASQFSMDSQSSSTSSIPAANANDVDSSYRTPLAIRRESISSGGQNASNRVSPSVCFFFKLIHWIYFNWAHFWFAFRIRPLVLIVRKFARIILPHYVPLLLLRNS